LKGSPEKGGTVGRAIGWGEGKWKSRFPEKRKRIKNKETDVGFPRRGDSKKPSTGGG